MLDFQEFNGSSAILSERRPVFVVEADCDWPRCREVYKGGEERKPSINWFGFENEVWVIRIMDQAMEGFSREGERSTRARVIRDHAKKVIHIAHEKVAPMLSK